MGASGDDFCTRQPRTSRFLDGDSEHSRPIPLARSDLIGRRGPDHPIESSTSQSRLSQDTAVGPVDAARTWTASRQSCARLPKASIHYSPAASTVRRRRISAQDSLSQTWPGGLISAPGSILEGVGRPWMFSGGVSLSTTDHRLRRCAPTIASVPPPR